MARETGMNRVALRTSFAGQTRRRGRWGGSTLTSGFQTNQTLFVVEEPSQTAVDVSIGLSQPFLEHRNAGQAVQDVRDCAHRAVTFDLGG
jgi:hypothetical protein